MRIVFKGLRFKNFLQTGNDFTQINLVENKFTAIIGKNGSGKSTILDALTYVLFKRPFRKIKLSQLINATNKKNLVVELLFSIGKDNYLIRRGEKPKIFEIYKNKVLIEIDATVNDYQEYLETNIIRQSYKTFTQINTIGKASYVQFMNLDPSSRREIIEDLLDTGIYDVMSNLCKEDIKTLKENIRILENDIYNTEREIKNINELLGTFESNKETRISDISSQMKTLETKENEIILEISSLKEEITQIENKLESLIPSEKREVFIKKFDALNKELGSLEFQLKSSKEIIAKIDNLVTCPTCLQEVDETHKFHIINENSLKIKEISTNLDDIRLKFSKFKDRKDLFVKTETEHNKKRMRIFSLENDSKHIKNQISNLKTSIDKIKGEELPSLPDISGLEESLKTMKSDNDTKQSRLKKLNTALTFLNDKGIKAALVNKYIPVINQSINSYLEMMGMFVEFELDSSFNEKIMAINRDNFSYESFSEGQKVRIDLAILLTWRKISQMRNSMSSNIFILDEVADSSLDDDGFYDFMNIMKTAFPDNNVLMISHKDSAIDLFDNIISVETQGNFSHYS